MSGLYLPAHIRRSMEEEKDHLGSTSAIGQETGQPADNSSGASVPIALESTPPISRFIGRTIGLVGVDRTPIVARGALVRRGVPASPKARVKLILAFLEAKAARRLRYKIILGLPTGESICGPAIERVVVRDSVAVVQCATWLLVGPIGFESLTLCSPEHEAVSTKGCIFTLDSGEQKQFRLEGRWGLT